MIPRTSSGRGFKGAAAYYLHDKGAATANRVKFTSTRNLSSDDPERAVNEMCWTAMHQQDIKTAAGTALTGRKLAKPVYTFSLSWHPTEQPTDDQMTAAALSALEALKMADRQIMMVAHNDTDHPHIHVLVNRVHPETGIAHDLKNDHLTLSTWAEKYEREFGQTWCADRVRNNADRALAKIEKTRGTLASAFVKDVSGQRRDRRPEFNRRGATAQREIDTRAPRRQSAVASDTTRNTQRHGANRIAPGELHRNFERAGEADARGVQNAGKELPSIGIEGNEADAAKRARFAAWEAELRNALQDKHLEERGSLGRTIDNRKSHDEQRVELQFGDARRWIEKQLAEIVERNSKAGRLARLIDKLQGRERERVRDALQKSLDDIAIRSVEMMQRGRKDAAQRTERMAVAQQEEKAALEKIIVRGIRDGFEVPIDHLDRGTGNDLGVAYVKTGKRDKGRDFD